MSETTYVRINKPKMIALLTVALGATKQAVKDSTAKVKEEYRTHLRSEMKKTDQADWSPESLRDSGEPSPMAKLLGMGNESITFQASWVDDNTNLIRKWLVYLQAQPGDEITLPEGLYNKMLDLVGSDHVMEAMDDALFECHATMNCSNQLGHTPKGEPLTTDRQPSPISGSDSFPDSMKEEKEVPEAVAAPEAPAAPVAG